MSKHDKRKWKRLRKFDVPGPLESYYPFGRPEAVPCSNEWQIEDRVLEPEGLYYNVESGEGAIV